MMRRSVRSLRVKSGVYGRLRYVLRMKRRPRSFAGLVRLLWEVTSRSTCCSRAARSVRDCGRRYPLWHADWDSGLWERVHGSPGGLLCPACFDRHAREKGISIEFVAVEFQR